MLVLGQPGLGRIGHAGHRRVEQQRGLIDQLLGRAGHADQAAEHRQPEAPILVGLQLLGRVDHHRRQRGVGLQRLDHLGRGGGADLHDQGVGPLLDRPGRHLGEVGGHIQHPEALAQGLGRLAIGPDQGDLAILARDETLHALQRREHGVALHRL